MTNPAASAVEMPAFDYRPAPYNGPSSDEVADLRRRYCHPSVLSYYREPLMIVDGHMQYLFDETGRRYLDFIAGIVTVSCGHTHLRVVAAVKDQVDRLQHATTIYLHPNLPRLAERIANKLPGDLDVTYFVNSGSEANELAINMARAYTGHSDVIAVRNSYHGMSSTSMGLTSHHTWKHAIPQGTRIHHAICPDPYRNPFEGKAEKVAHKSAEDIRDLIRFSTPGQVAAFIAEPIQGVGGATHGAPNYLSEAYAIIREHGGLCIADEVQTGFGRTGTHFWGFQNFDVVPDMVVMAKGIGNGVPLAAVTTRREIAEALTRRLHFNTYGGNPVSMAAGLAVLDVIEEDGLQENAISRARQLMAGLRSIQERCPIVGDVRGMGLMMGVELVRDRNSKDPAPLETAEVLEATRDMGLLIGKGGLFGNVLRIKPPLCITASDVDFALDVLEHAFVSATG
jgi:alanine-glyoxylate transaminase/(R)-3-amino-2-methylpropionate-pyruvate transaminase